MTIVIILVLLAVLLEVALHKLSGVVECPECHTCTFTRGLFTWACLNPDHAANCEREEGE